MALGLPSVSVDQFAFSGFVRMESYGIAVFLSVLVLSKFCDLSVPLHFQ